MVDTLASTKGVNEILQVVVFTGDVESKTSFLPTVVSSHSVCTTVPMQYKQIAVAVPAGPALMSEKKNVSQHRLVLTRG